MRCPSCDSDDTKRVQVVYEEGAYSEQSSISMGTTGGGVQVGSGGGVYTGAYASDGSITTRGMSDAARRVAPPSPMTPWKTLGGLIVFSAVVGVVVWFGASFVTDRGGARFFGALATLLLLFRSVQVTRAEQRFNRVEYPKRLQKWMRSWRCSRCGEIFDPEGGP